MVVFFFFIKMSFQLKNSINISLPLVKILDIGAMKEGIERFHDLVTHNLAFIIGFEPNIEEFSKLKSDSNKIYLPYFLGTGNQETFHLTAYPGCSSLFEPDPSVIDIFQSIGAGSSDGNFYVTNKEKIQTKKLDEINEIKNIDFIKIDTQGSELNILKNAVKTLKKTLIIETEVEFIPLYKNQPLFGDIQVFLREHGFILHKFIDVAGRALVPMQGEIITAPMSQLLWADAVFIRDYTKLELFNDKELLKSALIMNDVYNSYDLVLYFLTEYDKRRNTNLALKYISFLDNFPSPELKFLNIKT